MRLGAREQVGVCGQRKRRALSFLSARLTFTFIQTFGREESPPRARDFSWRALCLTASQTTSSFRHLTPDQIWYNIYISASSHPDFISPVHRQPSPPCLANMPLSNTSTKLPSARRPARAANRSPTRCAPKDSRLARKQSVAGA